ncbi:MAG: YdcF family protein [Thermodesulfovibrionales bacterium]|nr:YdcF family protein [Thermodesulfovibrionales bacterium]
MKKKKLVLPITALAFALILLCLAFIDQWLIIQDKPEKVDAIICLGGGSGERLQKVVELYKRGYAPMVILTASDITDAEFREFAVDLSKRFLIHKGVLPQSIVLEFESDSSYSEAKNIKAFMTSKDLHSAIIVSDTYHMRRASYVFKKVFHDGNGNTKLLFVPAEAKWAERPWWRNERSLVYVFNEVLKLGYYWVKY